VEHADECRRDADKLAGSGHRPFRPHPCRTDSTACARPRHLRLFGLPCSATSPFASHDHTNTPCFRAGTALLAAWLLVLDSPAQAAGTKLTLVRDGQPVATLVVSKAPGTSRGSRPVNCSIMSRRSPVPPCRSSPTTSKCGSTDSCRRQPADGGAWALAHRLFAAGISHRLPSGHADSPGPGPREDSFPIRVAGQPERVEGRFGQALEIGGACRGLSVAGHGFADEAGTLEAWVWLGSERPNAGTIFRLDGSPWTYHIVDTQGDTLRYIVYDGKGGRSVQFGQAHQWLASSLRHARRSGRPDGTLCRWRQLRHGGLHLDDMQQRAAPPSGRLPERRQGRESIPRSSR